MSFSSSACSDACWLCRSPSWEVAAARRTSAARARSSRPAASAGRLALQLAGEVLQLGDLQFDALAAGRHVRQPATHLIHHLELTLVGVIEHLPGVLGAVQGLVRLGPEQGGYTAADAHPGPLPFTGRRPWPDGTSREVVIDAARFLFE